MTNDKPLVLVDGSSYLFRAFHALPPLTTSDGRPTGAVRGVIGMLRRLAKDYQGSPIAVVFDAKGKTFRDRIYDQYKANRPPMPDDLRAQIAPVHDIVRAMGLPLLIVEDVEADDVIGTLAAQATRKQRDVVISTSDKDMAQLVSDHVTLVNTMSDTRMDRAGVVEKFGVTAEQIIDYLALMGDTVDNIPGVPKVGPKTAAKWLAEYGSLEGVMAHADEIGGKVGENLKASLEFLPLSKTLTTIKCDVELAMGIDELVPAEPDITTLKALFGALEFKGWLEELSGAPAASTTTRPAPSAPSVVSPARPSSIENYETVLDRKALEAWIRTLNEADEFAFDTETTSLDYMQARIVGVSFAVEGRAAYVPCGHDYPGAPDQLSLDETLDVLRPVLEDPARPKIGQNLKYDMNVLARHGVALAGIAYDTMLESYVIDSVATRHNMDDLAQKYLGIRTITFEEVAGKGAKQLTFNDVPVEQAAAYAAEDADVTLKLHRVLWPQLEAEPKLERVFRDIEMPLVAVLSRVERTGALVDGDALVRQSKELEARMRELIEQAWALAGEQFNLDSPKQLGTILYQKLELPARKKTPGGAPSTAEPVLAELALDYELPRVIMDYRSLAKLKSTYTDKLPLQINQRTGRIHTSYHQAVAATGRLSSSDPNLQNIPVRTAEGRRIRQAFVAPPGRLLMAADYSQIELRIMAHLSGDEGLRDAFARGLDVHRATAAEVFGVELEAVSADQRRSAKAINFGLIYGMSAFGLAKQLGVSRGVAAEYIERYFARYPGVGAYMDRVRASAAEAGYVETVFGRRLYLPEINARQVQRRQAAERTAINAPMQGTAADIIKRAMIEVDRWLATSGIDALMIMQVHDELVFEVAEADCEALGAGVASRMAGAAELDVELVVDLGQGHNWDEAH
ncbi:MAG: DNA polymerase I [Gammaproteobacteria bacterium]|nr:DNA polymerase I [Gammaproteobacteria bacterium]